MESNTNKKESKYKVLLLGDSGVGKSSIKNRLAYDKFTIDYVSIGVDFSTKRIERNDMNIKLQFWDLAGQERFATMSRVYYKDAVAAFIMFDVTCNSSLECAKKLKLELDQKVSLYGTDNPIPIVLIANKIDLCDGKYCGKTDEEMDNFCVEFGFVEWFGVSAKDNININKAVDSLVDIILENEKKFAVENSTNETSCSNIDKFFQYMSILSWYNSDGTRKT